MSGALAQPRDAVVGLDVGTTKICAVVGRPTSDGLLEVLGVGLEPAEGLKRGVVVDIQQTTASIGQAIRKAEAMAGVTIRSAIVGITGAHVSSLNVTGRASVSGRQVSREDCDRALQTARGNVGNLGGNREIIHIIPREYALDGQTGITRPLGMVGMHLEVKAHVVTGVSSIITNVRQCVEACDVEVAETVLEPVATAEATLTEGERDLGVTLIDIGGGTTDIAVFIDGTICHTSAIAVGGNHITRDVAIGLRVPATEAERLKCRAGHALPSSVGDRERVSVEVVGTGDTEHVPRRVLAEIIDARLEEVFCLVRADLQRSGAHSLVGGVVVSGGGSQLPGLLASGSRVLDGVRMRRGTPRHITGLAGHVSSPIYATAIGLALYGASPAARTGPLAPMVAPEGLFAGLRDRLASVLARLRRRGE
ncbi:MAG: cell division protein FtsA [Armatimonadota bacterium]